MKARQPFIIADADLAADRLVSHRIADALRVSAVCFALAVFSTLIGAFAGAALAISHLSREERKALILVGPSRTGKTELSRINGDSSNGRGRLALQRCAGPVALLLTAKFDFGKTRADLKTFGLLRAN